MAWDGSDFVDWVAGVCIVARWNEASGSAIVCAASLFIVSVAAAIALP